MIGELTGNRRYTRVQPWSTMQLPEVVMALEVEYTEFNYVDMRWECKWRWATPQDVENT